MTQASVPERVLSALRQSRLTLDEIAKLCDKPTYRAAYMAIYRLREQGHDITLTSSGARKVPNTYALRAEARSLRTVQPAD